MSERRFVLIHNHWAILMRCLGWGVFCLLLTACEAPQPVDIVIGLDTSASFAHFQPEALQTIKTLSQRLDPHLDRLSLLRMDRRGIRLLREGPAPGFEGIEAVLKDYGNVADEKLKGTPYRALLERVLQHLPPAEHKPERSSVCLILGDLANENSAVLSADFLTGWAKQLPPQTQVAFVGISPRFEAQLTPLRQVLYDRLIVVSAAEERASQTGLKQLLYKIQR